MITRDDWAHAFCERIGAPEGKRNMVALVAWQSAEGSLARFNPLATTQKMTGSSDFNWVGVQHYVSLEQGLEATLKTLQGKGHGYEPILKRLRRGAPPRLTLEGVEASDWGTGALAKSIVDDVKAGYDTYAKKPIGQ